MKNRNTQLAFDIFYFLGIILLGAILGTIVGFACAYWISGDISFLNINQSLSSNAIMALKAMQSIVHFFIFWLAAIIINKKLHLYTFKPTSTHFSIAILTPMAVLIGAPFIEFCSSINSKILLPDFFKWLENWMQIREKNAEEITKLLLYTKDIKELIINILMMAILPGIGEELIFRGCLQNILLKWSNKPHLAIWLAALIFGIIHLQFYGLIPRTLLGALFGYVYFWTKNIYYPIIGHFINNFMGVVVAYIYSLNNNNLEQFNNNNIFDTKAYILSILFSIALVAYIRQLSSKLAPHE